MSVEGTVGRIYVVLKLNRPHVTGFMIVEDV